MISGNNAVMSNTDILVIFENNFNFKSYFKAHFSKISTRKSRKKEKKAAAYFRRYMVLKVSINF